MRRLLAVLGMGGIVTLSVSPALGAASAVRPTIDLADDYDSGRFGTDNVTNSTSVIVLVTAPSPAGTTTVYNRHTTVGVGTGAVNVSLQEGTNILRAETELVETGKVSDGIDATTVPITGNVINISGNITGGAGSATLTQVGPAMLSNVRLVGAKIFESVMSEDLIVIVDSQIDSPSTPDLIATSDTGESDSDNITGKRRPAFRETAEANAEIRIRANGALVGEARVGSDESDGQYNGEGIWEVTVEPLDDGVYDITAEAEDLAGNISESEALQIEIDTFPPGLGARRQN